MSDQRPAVNGRRDAPQRRDITCRALDLTIRAETVDVEARSVEAVLSTESRVAVFDMRSYEVIDEVLLSAGCEIPGQMPLLNNHMRWDIDGVLGSIRDIRVEARQVRGRIFFAQGPADSPEERAWQKVRQGHLTDVSVGYLSRNYVDIPPGETQTVAGKSYTAGVRTLRVTTEWVPREGSVTPIGADQAAKIRQQAGITNRKDSGPMTKQLRAYLETLGLRSEATEDEAWAHYHGLEGDQRRHAEGLKQGAGETSGPAPAEPAGGQRSQSEPAAGTAAETDGGEATATQRSEPATTPLAAELRESVSTTDVARQAVADERERVRAIRQLGADLVSETLLERAVDDGWDVARANTEFLEYVRNHREAAIDGAPAGHAFQRSRHGSVMALAAGLMHRTSTAVVGAEFRVRDSGRGERLTEEHADYGDRYASWSLPDLCRACLQADGRSVPHDREEMIRAAFSTTSLSNVFTTSIHARMLASYEEAPDTSDWCSEEDLSNYQTVERTALGKTGALKKVGKGGTAPHATIDDSTEQYKLARYGEQFVVDEIDVLDDNLGGIQQIPVEMGMAAANLRPDLVYSIVLANAALGADSVALFNAASHNNDDSNALSLANIGIGTTAMMQQTQGGKRLNIRPRYLVVPGDLEFSAREFVQSTQIQIAGTAGAVTVRGSDNVIKDLNLQLRVEGRIDAAGVTDPDSGTAYTGSGTNWFLFSAAGRTVVVGYLAGTMRRPQVRRFVLDRGQWGLGWDIKHTIAAKALDFRGAYRGNS